MNPPTGTDATASDAWRRISDDLRAFVRRRLQDRHAADDLVQDVLTRFQREVAERGQPNQPAAWLFTAARNAVVDYYRTRRPHQELDDAALPASAAADTRDDLARLQASFRTFVMALPPKYREALLLTEYDGLSQPQLAAQLGIPLSTAKSRVQRARVQLAKALHDCCTFELDRRGGVVGYERRDDRDCPKCDCE